MKVILDTNVWIGFLIGKRLSSLNELIIDCKIKRVTTDQLIREIKDVTKREKLKKYFSPESVIKLIDLLEVIADKVEINPTHFINRDPKDNFLLDLIDYSKADYLVTGDKDLLEMKTFMSAKIFSPSEFEKSLIELD